MKNELNIYKNYIKECKELERFNIKKYLIYQYFFQLEGSILSIINQSFQNFEIIIVNDNSNDNTEKILKKLKLEDDRIKIIKHIKNLGVYSSRVEAILNAKGKYIIIMDPDDMILNPNLYIFNLNYNLVLIEFTVYHQEESKKTFFSDIHRITIINIIRKLYLNYQILFFMNQIHQIIHQLFVRTIWNKFHIIFF